MHPTTPNLTTKTGAILLGLAFGLGASVAYAASTPEPEPTTDDDKKDKNNTNALPANPGQSLIEQAVRSQWSDAPSGFVEAVILTKAGEHEEAIAKLKSLNMPNSANVLNYLGYNTRKLGNVDEGIRYYKQALAINPKHRGANEYLGEAYLMKNDLASARRQLGRLASICGVQCDEYKQLAEHISAFRTASARQ